jgi:septum formation protein
MRETRTPRLILASASPFRRKMLEAAGLLFEVIPAHVDEAALKQQLAAVSLRPGPGAVAEALARVKAEAVGSNHPGALIIGADQVLALGEELFDKPSDVSVARAQLEQLRGKTHTLHSAAALAQDGRIVWTCVDEAKLTMRSFSAQFLDAYLTRHGAAVCRTVGAYEIEGAGIQLFERVEGDHFTIIGLPLIPLLAELRSRGVLPA